MGRFNSKRPFDILSAVTADRKNVKKKLKTLLTDRKSRNIMQTYSYKTYRFGRKGERNG